jgi:hypothetical protein
VEMTEHGASELAKAAPQTYIHLCRSFLEAQARLTLQVQPAEEGSER